MKKRLFLSLIALALSLTFIFCGCTDGNVAETTTEPVSVSDSSHVKSFVFEVVDADGNATQKTIETEMENLGKVLQALQLIKGEEGPYGLYIKEINGITADYDTDGTYWAFYINGEYALSGVDQTDITDGYTYSFKVEKG